MKRHVLSLPALIAAVSISLGLILAGCQPTAAPETPRPLGKIYELWEPEPAPNRGGDFSIIQHRGYPYDEDWEHWSYPLGNGTLGANVFGRTDTERVQLSEKTFANGSCYDRGGITNAAELYLDFNHEGVTDYRRALSLNDAIKTVTFESDGVRYQREYFVSYPDDVMVIRLTADQAGALSLTVRPEIPYLDSVAKEDSRSGTVRAEGDTITLSGVIDYFLLNYEIQVQVLHEGGSLQTNPETIEIREADSVTLLVGAETNYELSPKIFLSEQKEKLDPTIDPHPLVVQKIKAARAYRYEELKARHLDDFRPLFERASIDLGGKPSDLPTHQLLSEYQKGNHDPYLEELMFQYGRYMLIASSRPTSLPAHLQGAWTSYERTPWTGGFWHNINIQMNYWGAMNTDLPETFEAYVNYFNAYLPKAIEYAQDIIRERRPDMFSEIPEENGWTFGNGSNAYVLPGTSPHSGPGTGAFITKMLVDYYDFYQDKNFLKETLYPALLGKSRFFAKSLYPDEEGHLLIKHSASPEIKHPWPHPIPGGKHYQTVGCTYDQGFVWENHTDLLRFAHELNISDPFLETVKEQIPRLDPILIGSSGQIKEFREEDAYGEIGDPHHRHISQLCGLYPGTLINSSRPEWMEAASKTLELRGPGTVGWSIMHRMLCHARLKEGEQAHDRLVKLLTEVTMQNLWTFHPPFQIDANLGVVAGIGECLLQSHEDFIEILPALPEAWATGNFDGLVARGNFKVSAQWQEGKLTGLSILSRSGGTCRVKVTDLNQPTVLDEGGRDVSFDSEENGIISFQTEPGQRYNIQ
jgi:alpha-L-fucosidase 2